MHMASTVLRLIVEVRKKQQNEESLLLGGENNNTTGTDVTGDGQVQSVVAMAATTSRSKSSMVPHPEDGASQEQDSADNVVNEKSTDDSSHCDDDQIVIDRGGAVEGGSEVTTADNRALDKDAVQQQQQQPLEGASDELVGDLKEDCNNPAVDECEEVVDGQCEETIDKIEDGDADNNKEDGSVEKENVEQGAKMDGAVVLEEDVKDNDENNEKGSADESWSKMHLTEDVSEGNQVQASSPGHHASASSSPTNIATTCNKSIQQNGVGSSKDSIKGVAMNDAALEETDDTDKTTSTSSTTNVVTNGNDHANITNEDDEEFTNNNKTDRNILEGKSSEYIQASEEPTINVLPPKRRMSQSSGADQITAGQTISKRMKISTLENQDFQTRDQILNSYIENMESSGFDGLKKHSELLLLEIQKLGEVAKIKEREWNQILHQKKLREELLLRLQRAKQIMVLQTNGNTNPKHQDQLLQRYQQQQQQQNQRQQQVVYQQQQDMAGLTDKGRQGPLVDVQKMISDYRQTHPESIPRRGRRIRGQDGQQRYETGNLLTFSNVGLGSGSQVRTSGSSNVANINQDIYNEFSLLLSSMDNDRLKTASSSSIKELLAQFARMSPSERQELLNSVKGPHNVSGSQTTNYPEVTVHAVQQQAALPVTPSASNSLLHGILTKPTKSSSTPKETSAKQQQQQQQQSFSPTLARLLTTPEQQQQQRTSTANQQHKSSTHSLNHHKSNTTASPSPSSSSATPHLNNNHQSLSDLIMSSTKARNEITITPVQQYEEHSKSSIHQQDEEADDSADRLVIDEGDSHTGRNNKQMDEEAAEEVPQCQGCNHKAAQFVCAGCGNQWYCSRECQVSAWDEHSEVCSG